MNLHKFKSAKDRREFLEKKLDFNLDKISKAFVDDENTVHCENLIGAVSLPLGVAGPVKISNLNKEFYLPLATSEGALVASVNRGCKAVGLAGGVNVLVKKIGATRGPVFTVNSLSEGHNFCLWLEKNKATLNQEAKKTSSHLELKEIQTQFLADQVYCRFVFDTSEAMGMNMVTIATQKIIDLIKKEKQINCLSVAGNYDIDKKPAWLNFIQGRGYQIWAEVFLEEKIINEVLKTKSEKIYEIWLAKCMIGSSLSGSLGFNAHFANIVAAFFAATGQDLAHIVEGSLGMTTLKITTDKKLHFSIFMPDVMLGSIGGGTKLAAQKQALKMTQAKNTFELAQILGAAVLAGELSLLASLSAGSLAVVHQKLGR